VNLPLHKHKITVMNVADRIIQHALHPGVHCEQPTSKFHEIEMLCHEAKTIFLREPMLLKLDAPATICGDIHGQYKDLISILRTKAFPSSNPFLFLGDYVDRGSQSIETMSLLLACKIKYPSKTFLLRGNHECSTINRIYGFYEECRRKINVKVWRIFNEVFDCLPVAAIISNKIFCVHGGLSPDLVDLEQINDLARPTSIPSRGLMCDLLWSDPETELTGWAENSRGVSYTFGENVVKKFLLSNGLTHVCRAHQIVENGYEFFADGQLVTLYSATNNVGEFDNLGAILDIDADLQFSFKSFSYKFVQSIFSQRKSVDWHPYSFRSKL